MRVLLDESLPHHFARLIVGHHVTTVAHMRWKGTLNGALLQQAVLAGFDVMITLDQGMEYQQDIAGHELAVIVLIAKSNRIAHLEPFIAPLLEIIPVASVGKVHRISWRDCP